jgi:AcrR family transcriptional regulator
MSDAAASGRRGLWSGDLPASEDEARRRIMAAAVRCVQKYGVDGTSTRLIADEAGVSRPTLYAYFENREEIVEQAAEAAVQGIVARMGEHTRTFTTAAERAVEALVFAVEEIRSEPAMAVFFQPGKVRLGPITAEELWFARTALAPVAELHEPLRDRLDEAAELFVRTMISWLMRGPAIPRTHAEDRAFLGRWWPAALGLEPGA